MDAERLALREQYGIWFDIYDSHNLEIDSAQGTGDITISSTAKSSKSSIANNRGDNSGSGLISD